MEPYMARKLPFEKDINYNTIIKKMMAANTSIARLDGMLELTFLN